VKRVPSILAVLAVLAVYVFFGTSGTWSFQRLRWYGTSPYASLAEGFRRGQLNLALDPEPRLMQLAEPYDFELRNREGVEYVWDASYFNGKYYLYFSPVPVLWFYVPFRIVGGAYPPDALAGTFFSAWAFIMSVLFAWRALAGRRLFLPFSLWVLLLGVGNAIPYVLASVRVYEVCVAASMAMSATWAWCLLRFLETRSARHAAWTGFWLAMAIVTRPNVGVLLLVAAFTITGKRNRIAALIPLVVIGAIAAWYNWARFGNPFELGVTYQLSGFDLRKYAVCSLCNIPELLRWFNSMLHYVFWSPTIFSTFPFVDLSPIHLDPAVSYPGREGMGGIAPLVPLAMLGTLFALIVRAPDSGTRASLRVMTGAWLIVAGLSACWYVVARYSLDFILLMAMASVVLIERGTASLAGLRSWPLRIVTIVLLCWSVLIGCLLGFQGNDNRFRTMNHDLFQSLSKRFDPHEPGRDLTRPGPRK
jgi:hypothetical protein